MHPSSTDNAPAAERPPRRRRAGVAAAAVALAAVASVGGPVLTAGADEPALPQDVQLFHEIDGCELHLGALDEIEAGAEVHVRMTSDDPAVFEQTFAIDSSGLFDESLTYGDEIMAGVGGGNLLMMELTVGDVVVDDYAAPVGAFPGCDGLAPLTVTIDAIGSPPAGVDLQVEVRTGECGNAQNPSAVISTNQPGSSFTVWALPGSSCPSPVDSLGAVVTYDPDQQTQVEAVVGADVTVFFDFTAPSTDPVDPEPTDTTSTTTPTSTVPDDPTPTTPPTADTAPDAVTVLAADLTSAPAAAPVVVSPSFTG